MNSFDNSFCEKNALVVGGSGGIGKSISLALAKSGASVTVHGGHASEKFDSLLREMNSFSESEFHSRKHRQIILDFEKINLEEFDKKNLAQFSNEDFSEKIHDENSPKNSGENFSEKNLASCHCRVRPDNLDLKTDLRVKPEDDKRDAEDDKKNCEENFSEEILAEKINGKFFEKNCGNFATKNSDEFSSLENLKSALRESEILCVCYGPFLQKKISETSACEWIWTTRLNLALPGILAGYAARFMKKRGFGRILFFGGTRTNQINGFKTNAAYAAAKTGIASLTKSFALEFGEHGIYTAAIFPGFVKTEYISAKKCAEYEKILGGKKMICADEVARAALFLLSDPNLNGTLLEMNGGWRP